MHALDFSILTFYPVTWVGVLTDCKTRIVSVFADSSGHLWNTEIFAFLNSLHLRYLFFHIIFKIKISELCIFIIDNVLF